MAKKAIKVTKNSWLMQDTNKTLALISKHNNGGFNVLDTEKTNFYEDWKSIEKDHGKLSEHAKKNMEKDDEGPLGLPVKHEEMYNVDTSTSAPTYTSKPHSHVKFYAGYWILRDTSKSNKYGMALSPKVTTVKEKENYGPYKNRMDCLNEMNILNSRKND